MRPQRLVLAVVLVAAAVLVGEPLHEVGLVGERWKLDGYGAHLLLGEERLAVRQELGPHRRWDAGGDRAVRLREAVLIDVAGGEPARAAVGLVERAFCNFVVE